MYNNKEITKYPKKELKKHSSIIHCSNSLSLLQRKIANALLFHAYNSLLEHEEHKISIKELCSYLQYRGRDTKQLKNAIKALISTVVEWNLVGDDQKDEDWTASSLLACANIKGAVCTYAYSTRMRSLLFSPSMYGKINLSIQSNFTSSYGLALYENIIRYKGLPKSKFFPIEVFRKLMGVPNGTYVQFRDFKRRVIDKAAEEVNTLSDIFITPIIKRVGRTVIGISFDVEERSKKKSFISSSAVATENNIGEEESSSDLRLTLIKTFNMSNEVAINLLNEYGKDKINEKIHLIKNACVNKKRTIKNVTGYLIDALKNDYIEPPSSEVFEIEGKQKKAEREKSRLNNEQILQEAQKSYEQYRLEFIEGLIKNMSQLELNTLCKSFIEYLKKVNLPGNKKALLAYERNEFNDQFVLRYLERFFVDHHPTLLRDIKTFDEVMKTKNAKPNKLI